MLEIDEIRGANLLYEPKLERLRNYIEWVGVCYTMNWVNLWGQVIIGVKCKLDSSASSGSIISTLR
jgi:hypothetical protein